MSEKSSPPLLVLIGFMGAGKTTLGRMLAAKLACPFVDLDAEITRVHGSIAELFAAHGESGFRAIEHEFLGRTLERLRPPAILALGGGAFIQTENRHLLDQHSATTILLDAPFPILRSRLAGTGQVRPLARDLERLEALYLERRPAYSLAHHTVDTSGSDPAKLVASLVELAHSLGVTVRQRDKL